LATTKQPPTDRSRRFWSSERAGVMAEQKRIQAGERPAGDVGIARAPGDHDPGLRGTDLRQVLLNLVDDNPQLVRLSVDVVKTARSHGLGDTEAGVLLIAIGCQLLDAIPLEVVSKFVASAPGILGARPKSAE